MTRKLIEELVDMLNEITTPYPLAHSEVDALLDKAQKYLSQPLQATVDFLPHDDHLRFVQQRDELLKKAVEQAQEIERLNAFIKLSADNAKGFHEVQAAEIERKAQYGKEWMDKYLELRKAQTK